MLSLFTPATLSSAEASYIYGRTLGKKNSRSALRLGKGKIKARGEHLLTGASAEERAPARRINGYGNGNHNAGNNLAMHFMLQTPELSLMRHLTRE